LKDRTISTSHNICIIIQQKTGVAPGTRILNILGDNWIVEEMTYIGNIATDTGEQNHAVFVNKGAVHGATNGEIKGIRAFNIRGDGLYIGGGTLNPQNIKIGNVYVSNCYRNGISLTGGNNIEIGNVLAIQCGMIGVDLESDTAGGHINGVKIGNVITSNLGVIAAGTGYSYCENVDFGFVVCRKSNAGSTPDYPVMTTDQDAVTFRNARNIRFKGLDIDGFDRHALLFNISGGDRYNDNITIDTLVIANCSLVDVTYNSYVNVAGVINLVINKLDSTTQTGKEAFAGTSKTAAEQNVIINSGKHTGGRLGYNCGVYLKNIIATSNVGVLGSIKALSKIINSSLTGATYLITYSDNVIFEANTIVYTTGKESNGVNIYRNNIVNTVYTA
jgi:hypothetical protein